MRALYLTLALIALVSPALAQYWGHYANARFGYEIDVPPGFEGYGESADGVGQVFYSRAEGQELSVWGGVLEGSLEGLVQSLLIENTAAGWNTTSQASTPQWANLSGVQPQRSFFQRMIVLCDGQSYAAFRVEFDTAMLSQVEPVLQGLSRSLVAVEC